MAVITTFKWEPDPMIYEDQLTRMAVYLEDRMPPLQAASIITQEDIRERFDTETDPYGDKWADWSPSYTPVAMGEVPAKKGEPAFPNIGILQRTGELADAASSSRATRITKDTVFYETSTLPNYGLEHETGNPNRNLPQRAFLGLSDQARTVIFAAFADWFDGAMSLWVTPSGKVAMRHSLQGKGGFVSRASIGRGPLPKL